MSSARSRIRKDDVSAADRRAFDRLIRRRVTGEPIPFIKGYAEFRGLELLARPGVFVPRDASENLVEQATRRLREGAGPCTSIWRPGRARSRSPSRTRCQGRPWWEPICRRTRSSSHGRTPSAWGSERGSSPATCSGGSLGSSRAPWTWSRCIRRTSRCDELKDLPEEIRDWEPEHTLTDRSRDGLGLIGRTAREAPTWLSRNGWLLMEVESRPGQAREAGARAGGLPRHAQHQRRADPAHEGRRREAPGVTQVAPLRRLGLADQRRDGVGGRCRRSRSRGSRTDPCTGGKAGRPRADDRC